MLQKLIKMDIQKNICTLILLVLCLVNDVIPSQIQEFTRGTCKTNLQHVFLTNAHKQRLHKLREQMLIRAGRDGPEIHGYILTSFDEHLNTFVNERDRRIKYLTGFTGATTSIVTVTLRKAALWTDKSYLQQANVELSCDWDLFEISDMSKISTWFAMYLNANNRIGMDPYTTPHSQWNEFELELSYSNLKLVRVNQNLVDFIWDTRPPPEDITIKVHEVQFAGEKWQQKINRLRNELQILNSDAIIITSLTEIAYLLNIRGKDIPFTPVTKAYMIVTQHHVILYTDRRKLVINIQLHLRTNYCDQEVCVEIKDYNSIWEDLFDFKRKWRKRVIVPAPCTFEKGVSEAIYSVVPNSLRYEITSPVILMKAQKNFVERQGMKMAHIRDGAAIAEAMSNLEKKFSGREWTELNLQYELDRSLLSQPHSKGLSFETTIAFGYNGAHPYYRLSNATNIYVNDQSTLIIDSGGQYLEGTTDVSRTFHFGTPTKAEKQAYTNILSGIIKISNLKFPADLQPSEIDALSRSPLWGSHADYPESSGHGIGSFLSVKEAPIDMKYHGKDDHFSFKDGYFFSNKPGYYKPGDFGVRLGNVLEVVDTGILHPSGSKFLSFQKITLVPYEAKLIDRTMLSSQEKRWLNKYNAKIREHVGEELKRQGNMDAFYWMMNKTHHIREFLPENEYIANYSQNLVINYLNVMFLFILTYLYYSLNFM